MTLVACSATSAKLTPLLAPGPGDGPRRSGEPAAKTLGRYPGRSDLNYRTTQGCCRYKRQPRLTRLKGEGLLGLFLCPLCHGPAGPHSACRVTQLAHSDLCQALIIVFNLRRRSWLTLALQHHVISSEESVRLWSAMIVEFQCNRQSSETHPATGKPALQPQLGSCSPNACIASARQRGYAPKRSGSSRRRQEYRRHGNAAWQGRASRPGVCTFR